jgi:squalene-hopene/tetraprenyl-beta-curcumene cyclase
MTRCVRRLVNIGTVATLTLLAGHAHAAAPEQPAPSLRATLTATVTAPRDAGLSPEQRALGERIAQRAIEYLKARQDRASGGWSVPDAPARPHLPAITALVLNGLLLEPGLGPDDPAVADGLRYILSFQKPDGGIYDSILPSYNTAICLSTLARANDDRARQAIPPAQNFLKRLQWGHDQPAGMSTPGQHGTESPERVDPSDPRYGGLGYGHRGRPDISNLAFALQAWHDSGLPADDPAFQRALVFLQRVQMLERTPDGRPVNDQPYARGSTQGGFIYATAENADTIGQGQSFAGTIEETLSDGTVASRLRAYGSVTYAGFKSYIYAGLSRDDPRVTAAVDWASRHWTLLENPGLGTDGYWYYLVMLSRALDTLGQEVFPVRATAPLRTSLIVGDLPGPARGREGAPELSRILAGLGHVPRAITPLSPDSAAVHYETEQEALRAAQALREPSAPGPSLRLLVAPAATGATPSDTPPRATPSGVHWRAALIEQLALRQNPDGSFASVDDRWMENNPVLVTAYGLLALQHALGRAAR